jgi:protein-disulfide isomerase
MPLLLNRILLVLSAIGVFVASVLSYAHLTGKSVGCGVASGCDWLTGRPESKIGPIPIAVFGLAAYLAIFAATALRATDWNKWAPKLNKPTLILTGLGFVISMSLVFMLTVVWKQSCVWCFSSAATMTLLLIGHVPLQKFTNQSAEPVNMDAMLVPFLLIGAIGIAGAYSSNTHGSAMVKPAFGLKLEQILPDDTYFRGKKDARITVVEIADFYCSACRLMSGTFKTVEATYSPNIRMGYRTFPIQDLPGHEMSLQAAFAAEYARKNGKYFEFVELMFTEDGGKAASEEDIAGLLDQVGLDGATWLKTFTDDTATFDSILEFKTNLQASGVASTPTYVVFVDGKDPVFMPAPEIEAFLKKAPYYEILTGKPAPATTTDEHNHPH